ncbi:lysosomal acid glucosylceramidase-like [Anthonomus grandis grandis]|uniref:lysosomal acid glucosylceramidase-like n=1 Tax=Anthonomus grandis grandis TaxID=2921223 RepID=UPI002165F928|nr:lysosomal acid glucosylceramidase-like [Anthonomus grandis grandis]
MGKVGYFAIFLAFIATVQSQSCNSRTVDYGIVCVCNASYCDTVPALEELSSGQYQLYTTSKNNAGFSTSIGTFSNATDSASVTVTVSNLSSTHQTIIGFGGAFTDATGINIVILSEAAQEHLLQSYYGENGIQYSIGRVPIGGTDYSTRGYTYCDNEDETLESFALQEEDFNYKIPIIQRALELRNGQENLLLYASVWSAPLWMKTNDAYSGKGKVQTKYLELWAQYFLKFFDAYAENDISFWGVTTQNEPENGITGIVIPNNGFTAPEMADWIKNYMGPAIRNSSYSSLKIIAHDDNRALLPVLSEVVLSDDDALHYIDGIGLHWYTDFITPATVLNMASSSKKELFRLSTEACTGYFAIEGLDIPIRLGSWDRGQDYISSIMTHLEYDFIGWTDWNMALNTTGGPNYIDNPVDSPIIVNATSDEFYKQPMFYGLGHFSKFIVPGSVRIDIELSGLNTLYNIHALAFLRPDGKVAVVLNNRSGSSKTIKVNILGSTQILSLDGNSLNTLLYTV